MAIKLYFFKVITLLYYFINNFFDKAIMYDFRWFYTNILRLFWKMFLDKKTEMFILL